MLLLLLSPMSRSEMAVMIRTPPSSLADELDLTATISVSPHSICIVDQRCVSVSRKCASVCSQQKESPLIA